MPEIAGREVDGCSRCVSVRCGMTQAGPPLDLRCKPTWAATSSQVRVDYCLLVCCCGGWGMKCAPLWWAVCNCALVVLVGRLSIRPILEHRQRSLTCVRVGGFENLWGARKMTGEIPSLSGCIINWPWAYAQGSSATHLLGPERWWTMPEQGEAKGNSDWGS